MDRHSEPGHRLPERRDDVGPTCNLILPKVQIADKPLFAGVTVMKDRLIRPRVVPIPVRLAP